MTLRMKNLDMGHVMTGIIDGFIIGILLTSIHFAYKCGLFYGIAATGAVLLLLTVIVTTGLALYRRSQSDATQDGGTGDSHD